MSDRDLQLQRNNVARLFRMTSSRHLNCVRLNANNTKEHELKKAALCYALLKGKRHFLTEAEFERPFKLRCDIVCLDTGTIYEIVKSESEASILRKKNAYPLPIMVVKCGN